MSTTPTTNTADLIRDLRSVSDQIDEHNAALKLLGEQWDALERAIMQSMDQQGLVKDGEKVGTSDGTATRGTKEFVQYEPEKWDDFVRWAVARGRIDFFHRRTSDAKIIDAIINGAVLPEGITVGSKPTLSFRRK